MSIRKSFAKFLHNVADSLEGKPQQPELKKLTPWEIFQEQQDKKLTAHFIKRRKEIEEFGLGAF